MRVEEIKKLRKGTKVWWNLGDGWRCHGKFLRVCEGTRYAPITFNDLTNNTWELKDGKRIWFAVVEYIDHNGHKKTEYVSSRRLHTE